MLLASCGEGVLPSSEALALSSECSQVKEFRRREAGDEALLVTNLQGVVVGVELVEGLVMSLGQLPKGRVKPLEGFFWLPLRKPWSLTPWLPT